MLQPVIRFESLDHQLIHQKGSKYTLIIFLIWIPLGYGIYTAKDGSQYKGKFENGKANGYGVYTFKDGSKYWGPFVDDKREGRGKEVQADGLVYTGIYV